MSRLSSIFCLAGAIGAVSCGGGHDEVELGDSAGAPLGPGGKADSPYETGSLGIDHGHGEVPVPEVSGLALRTWNGSTELLAIGDSEPVVAVAGMPASVKPSELTFTRYDLGAMLGNDGVSQWEAITCDGDGKVFVLEEGPGAVYVFSPTLDELLYTYELGMDDSGPDWRRDLAKDWGENQNSRGEGLALGAGGHLIVVKEKEDPAIVEFGPEDEEPAGLSSLSGASFEVPTAERSRLVPLRVWEMSRSATDALPDLSDLFVDARGRLYLVSGDGRTLGRVRESLDADLEGKLHFDAVWKLPKSIENPEGLILFQDEEPWIASDSPDDENLFELDRIDN